MPALPGHNAGYDQADGERPFRLVAAPARSFLNTTFTETPGSLKREKRPTLLIHPAAAADLGIADGQRVRLGNRQGSLVIRAAFFDGLQPDVVVVESIWPNRPFEEGRGTNLRTRPDPGRPAGGGGSHAHAVWLQQAGG